MGMTLTAALPQLMMDIEDALNDAVSGAIEDSEDGQSVDMEDVHMRLAEKLANAIHAYTTQAVVQSFVNTAVIGVGGGVPGPMVGTGLGVANGKLL